MTPSAAASRMPFSTPAKKPFGHRAADDPLGELDAAVRVRLELEPDVAEHPVAAGLLLVAAVDLGLAADRLLVRDLRRVGHDRGPELALEPLDDDRGVGLAHRPQDLLAGRATARAGRSAPPRASAGSAGPILSRSPLRCGSMATISDGAGKSSGGRTQRLLLRRQRVAGLGHGQLGDRADLAGLELADRLLLLAVEQQQLADPLVLAAGRVPDVGLRVERARQDAQVGQPPDERVGGRLEHADEQRAVLVGRDLDRRRRPCRWPGPAASSAGEGR